jgi:hypothetical protein
MLRTNLLKKVQKVHPKKGICGKLLPIKVKNSTHYSAFFGT